MTSTPKLLTASAGQDAIVNLSGEPTKLAGPAYDQSLLTAKQMAKENPRMVASVVSNWTNGNE
jgi:flagellar M-ring protein FliF